MGHAAADFSTIISWRSSFVKMKKQLTCLLATTQSCGGFREMKRLTRRSLCSQKTQPGSLAQSFTYKRSQHGKWGGAGVSLKRPSFKLKNQSQFSQAKKKNQWGRMFSGTHLLSKYTHFQIAFNYCPLFNIFHTQRAKPYYVSY